MSRAFRSLVAGAAILAAAAPPASAAPALTEDFDYPAGDNLTGKAGGTGLWTAAWAAASGTLTVTTPAGPLTYPGIAAGAGGNSATDATTSAVASSRTWN